MTSPKRLGWKSKRGQLAPFTPTHCVHCGTAMVVDRHGPRPLPRNRHVAHGLCAPCYGRRRHNGVVGQPVYQNRAVDLLDKWEMLRAAEGLTTRGVAQRLGMKYETLDRALHRARQYRKRDAARAAAELAEQQQREEAERFAAEVEHEVALLAAETEAHRINNDMIAYALRKAS